MADTKVSLYAVFDGHGGDEASQLASQNLHKRFLHHLYKRVHQTPGLPSADEVTDGVGRMTSSTLSANTSGFLHAALGVILKEALAEAIADVESSFSIVSCTYRIFSEM